MSVRAPEMLDPPQMVLVFDAHPHPDMQSPREFAVECFEAFRPLRKDLVLVPVGPVHHPKDTPDAFQRDLVVEKVAHAVHEHALRLLPTESFFQFFRDEPQIEALFERVSRYATKPFCKSFRVAVLAAGTDFGAAPNGVPGRIRPFDR